MVLSVIAGDSAAALSFEYYCIVQKRSASRLMESAGRRVVVLRGGLTDQGV